MNYNLPPSLLGGVREAGEVLGALSEAKAPAGSPHTFSAYSDTICLIDLSSCRHLRGCPDRVLSVNRHNPPRRECFQTSLTTHQPSHGESPTQPASSACCEHLPPSRLPLFTRRTESGQWVAGREKTREDERGGACVRTRV